MTFAQKLVKGAKLGETVMRAVSDCAYCSTRGPVYEYPRFNPNADLICNECLIHKSDGCKGCFKCIKKENPPTHIVDDECKELDEQQNEIALYYARQLK